MELPREAILQRDGKTYGGNRELLRTPSKCGGSEPYDRLAEYPHMKTLWKGYSFERGYYEDRGHVYSLEDVKSTPPAARPRRCASRARVQRYPG